MKLTLHKTLLLGLTLCFAAANCARQPETIVASENPRTPAPADTAPSSTSSAGFKQLIIGELHPVRTFDPLFADENSTMRTLQLVFEGLVRLDENGDIEPAIARSWTVSGDSLTYTFQLRDDVYFHDSNIFNSGVGRRVMASDVKYALERMANNNVPGKAAQLFMSIEGFEPYSNESHQVLNPALRRLNGVSGITLPGNNRLVIRLTERDPDLLLKLASPYAVIYPREAVAPSPQNFAVVGSGPFLLSQRVGTNGFIFARNEDYRQAPVINRVDVLWRNNETELIQLLSAGDLHLVPELGPSFMGDALAADGSLQPDYNGNFNLVTPGGYTSYFVKYHAGGPLPLSSLRSLIGTVDPGALTGQLPSSLVSASILPADTEPAPLQQNLNRPFTDDLFENMILGRLSANWNLQGSLSVADVRVPTRTTALYTDSFVSLYAGQGFDADDTETLVTFSVEQAALVHNRIENLQFNMFPWWMDLRNVNLPEIDQL